jgi:hypothetical protein
MKALTWHCQMDSFRANGNNCENRRGRLSYRKKGLHHPSAKIVYARLELDRARDEDGAGGAC